MILDTSAVVSILFEEDGFPRLVEAMDGSELGIGAPTLVETAMVLVGNFDLHGRALLAQFMERNRIVVIPFDDRHRDAASEAFIRYGKGRHPAALNYGDCMTYATARVAGAPLLFVGEDFAQTDIAPA
ncbi:MAG TPA: type II toxin-antitoxin system VapC family toxin [Solirubrobacterales bacterium]|nr:type II toxin-antitoxin system VapC family toxin [Solirubrobacterales bacterium]